MRALPPCAKVSTVTTGVPKSATSRRRSRLRGTEVLRKSTISVLALLADVDAGRWRRTGRRRCGPRRCGRGGSRRRAARAARRPACASAKRWTWSCAAASAVALVGQRHQRPSLPSTLRLERLRLVQVEHDARAVAGLDDVEAAQRGARRPRAALPPRPFAVSRKSSAMRGGLAIAKPAGGLAGGALSWNRTIVRPELPRDTVTCSMLLAACASAMPASASAQNAASRSRANRGARRPHARCERVVARSRSSSCSPGGLWSAAAAAACWSARSSRRRRPARVPSA